MSTASGETGEKFRQGTPVRNAFGAPLLSSPVGRRPLVFHLPGRRHPGDRGGFHRRTGRADRPRSPSYFNAGHHHLIYSVADYLRRQPEVDQVDTIDASVESRTWKEIGDRLHQGGYDVVAVTNDLD
uniref:hypothetical protein n=1 Tax=Streptomyces halstedii TaxID=1944 RepID=UPI0012FF1B09